jgi:hypothetical protein
LVNHDTGSDRGRGSSEGMFASLYATLSRAEVLTVR